VKENAEQAFWPVSEARYCAIQFQHNGRLVEERVGRKSPVNGELVQAIFRAQHDPTLFVVWCAYPFIAHGVEQQEQIKSDRAPRHAGQRGI